MSYSTFEKLKLEKLDSKSLPHVVGASGESLGTLGKTSCEIQINNTTFIQTFIVCQHLKRPLILGRDFSIQNHMGISWTKHNTRQLTQYNEVIAETKEYQLTSRAAVSLKNNVKVPPRSCAVQGLFVPYARIGSGDPVRVLRLFHNKYSGYIVAFIYCVRLRTTCHYLDYVLTTTGCLCNSGLLARADVHCSVSRGQLTSGTVLYLFGTVYFGTIQSSLCRGTFMGNNLYD